MNRLWLQFIRFQFVMRIIVCGLLIVGGLHACAFTWKGLLLVGVGVAGLPLFIGDYKRSRDYRRGGQ